MRRWAAALCVALTACGGGGGDLEDDSAELACERFRRIASEHRTLTDEQITERLQNVETMARTATARLADTGEDLVAASIRGTGTEMNDAINAFGAECDRLGY